MRLIAKKNNFSVVTSKNILNKNNSYDAILVGAGIMSGTLALLITEILPAIKILIIEKLNKPGSESTGAFNNAGTCLLYTSPSPRDMCRSRMPSSA